MSPLQNVVNKSILEAPMDFAIAHCISADGAMGITKSGEEVPCLALDLRKRYPSLPEICKMERPLVGEVLTYQGPDGRIIFNLVTKLNYFDKPTYENMKFSLRILLMVIVIVGVNKLAIPKLGSGLDKLDWTIVSALICEIFYESGIEIVLYDPKGG